VRGINISIISSEEDSRSSSNATLPKFSPSPSWQNLCPLAHGGDGAINHSYCPASFQLVWAPPLVNEITTPSKSKLFGSRPSLHDFAIYPLHVIGWHVVAQEP
jgi:hypothetical protein